MPILFLDLKQRLDGILLAYSLVILGLVER
jgi:hypothetical protein